MHSLAFESSNKNISHDKHPKGTKFILTTNIGESLESITSAIPSLLKHFQVFLQKSKNPRRSPKNLEEVQKTNITLIIIKTRRVSGEMFNPFHTN